MKVKTSVSLSPDLIAAIDTLLEADQNRSSFLEVAGWQYVERRRRAASDRQDIEIINRVADELNAEASDVLTYQVDL